MITFEEAARQDKERALRSSGGPAFPHTIEYRGIDCGGVVPHGGMTLRDYFAVQANDEDIKAQVEIMHFANQKRYGASALPSDWRIKARYMHADAMLKAREA